MMEDDGYSGNAKALQNCCCLWHGEEIKEQKWKIKPLDQGQVCIYFPAEKETSNLRFSWPSCAPFASTVARDSIPRSVNSQLMN